MRRDEIIAASKQLVFVEREPHEKGFSQYFAKYLQNKLVDVEMSRLRHLKIFRIYSLLSLPIFLGLLGLIIYLQTISPTARTVAIGLYACLIAFAVLAGVMIRRPTKTFIKKTKKHLLPDVFTFFGPFRYAVNGNLPVNVVRGSKLFENWQRIRFEDHISGNYDGLNLEMAEVTLQRKTKDKDQKYVALKDLVIVFYLGRKLSGQTIITLKDHDQKMDKSLHPITIDHSHFERFFSAHSSNASEARDVITPHLAKSLINLHKQPEVFDLACSFIDNKLLLRISNRQNLFEPRTMFQSALDTQDVRKFLSQIHSVLTIVKAFSEETKILSEGVPSDTPRGRRNVIEG